MAFFIVEAFVIKAFDCISPVACVVAKPAGEFGSDDSGSVVKLLNLGRLFDPITRPVGSCTFLAGPRGRFELNCGLN